MKIEIRESTVSDINDIVNAFYFFLEEIKDFPNQDLTLSNNNIELFRMLLRNSIEELDICPLLACVEGKIVGLTFWIQVLGFDLKKPTVTAFGTYVEPEYRNKGVAKILAIKSFDILKAKGIQRIVGKIVRENSEKYIESLGMTTETITCKEL